MDAYSKIQAVLSYTSRAYASLIRVCYITMKTNTTNCLAESKSPKLGYANQVISTELGAGLKTTTFSLMQPYNVEFQSTCLSL